MRRHPKDGPPTGRLRLAILAATVAAFLLVPAAQALAAGHLKVNVVGTGSGEILSEWGFADIGSPPITCSYASPGPATGVCENEMAVSGGKERVEILSVAGAGSDVGSVILQKGNDLDSTEFGPGYSCNGKAGQEEIEEFFGGWACEIEGVGGTPSAEVTVAFCLEGQSLEECLPPAGLPLKVTHEGTGSGTIQSNPAGITCTTGECEHGYAEGTEVTLTASPAAGSAFVSWKNCDTGGVHGRQCTVHVTPGHKTVGAKFEPANTVTVKTKGTGTGSVSGVTCGNTCTEASGVFLASKAVTLKAKPYAKNSEFKGWTASPASCTLSEEGKTCSLGMLSADETVEAEFAEIARETLTVAKSGNGQGAVKSSPAGINCSYTCGTNAAYFYKGTTVTLTASVQAGKGSELGNWGGGTCSGSEASPCVVTMSGAKSVTAEFK